MKKIEFAHELLSESRRSTQLYLESGRDYHKAKAHMYSIFECYAHGLIGWNQVRTRWHNSILEYLNLYADRPDLYLKESNRMLGEYETTLQTYKPALDEYKRVNEQKMTSNIVVKGKLNESQAKQQSNLYFNRRALNENQLTDTAGMKTWKQVQESYPNLTSKDELRIRMLTIFEGSTVDTTKLVTTYMQEAPTAISGPMQTSTRPQPRPASQNIGAGSQATQMSNGSVDGSTRGIDPADVYSPEDLAKLTGQPAPRSPLAPTTSPRPLLRPTTLKQSANNNIRKEAVSIFNKIKLIANEGYKVLPPMNKERYTEIPGLEGPFTTLSGKVVYYDPKEGAYYDRDTDMYLSADEYTALNSDYSGMQDERDIKIREAKKPKPGHNARVMARAQDTIRKSIEKSKKDDDDKKEKVDEAGSYRDRGAQNMMRASRKADKEADKVRAQRDKDEAKKKKENVKESYKMTETTEEVDDFLRELNADDVGVSDVGAYRVHYEGFSDWCQSDAEERCSLPTNDPRHLNSYDDIYDEVLRDFIAREDGKQPIESGLTGDEDYPVFYAVFDREIVSEAVAKIACVKCDEVSTAAAWKKNNGTCPKCKTSKQGVAESVNEAQSMGDALKNALSRPEPGSKLDHKIKVHNRAIKGGADPRSDHPDLMPKAPSGHHFDKKGMIRLGEGTNFSEAVTLDYSRYMRSHGKKPRDAGGGSSTWMFTTAEFSEPGEDEIFQFQGNFADAKKAAAKWAKSQGQYRVYAMEDAAPKINEQKTITEAQFDEAAGEKDACYHKVKSRYKVWPSAYASGALSKCRKVGASNWGKSKE